jgi:ParB family chromosome partitioning protein
MSAKEVSPRLGRGLAALMGDTAKPTPIAQPAAGIATIPIELIEPGPFQPRGRIDPASLTDLVGSIRARGILQPLLARPHPGSPGHYQIIAGERRWRAAQAAGLHEVPVLVRSLEDADALAAALVENLQRQDLNAIEEAEGYKRLLDEYGMTQETLAIAVGKSRSHIANTLRLLNLPPSVQQEVRNGALSPGHARALLAHPEPAKAAIAVIAGGLSVRQTEALIERKAARPSGPAPADPGGRAKDGETLALERDLEQRLGMKVAISFDGKTGTLQIHYRSLDQLDRLLELLSR